jgi:hypothetical protein
MDKVLSFAEDNTHWVFNYGIKLMKLTSLTVFLDQKIDPCNVLNWEKGFLII